jgi:hypothetical protein
MLADRLKRRKPRREGGNVRALLMKTAPVERRNLPAKRRVRHLRGRFGEANPGGRLSFFGILTQPPKNRRKSRFPREIGDADREACWAMRPAKRGFSRRKQLFGLHFGFQRI